jgi:hypothetical protein
MTTEINQLQQQQLVSKRCFSMQEEQELPWWSVEELQGAAVLYEMYYADHPPPTIDWHIPRSVDASADIDWMYFRPEVLDKYRNHKYCDIGYDHDNQCEYIRFLSLLRDRPPQSAIHFHFANASIKIKAADYINIPARQMQHWKQHQIQ